MGEEKRDNDASFITNQAEVIPKLKSPAGEGIDVSFANVYQIEQFKQAGIVTPITEEDVPNIGNLFPELTGDLYTDENGDYVAVPYNTGWLGLAYNEEAVGNPNNWDVLFEPEMKGRVGVWDDMITNMQLVSVIHGFDPQKLTQEQLEVVKEWLAKLRPRPSPKKARFAVRSVMSIARSFLRPSTTARLRPPGSTS